MFSTNSQHKVNHLGDVTPQIQIRIDTTNSVIENRKAIVESKFRKGFD